MNDAVLGALALYTLGLGFSAVALQSWLRDRGARIRRPRPGIVVNAVIGLLAVGDAAASLVDEPTRTGRWCGGAVALLVVGGVLVVRHLLRSFPRRSALRPHRAGGEKHGL